MMRVLSNAEGSAWFVANQISETVFVKMGWAGTMDKDDRFTFSDPIAEAIRTIARDEIKREKDGLPQRPVPAEDTPKVADGC